MYYEYQKTIAANTTRADPTKLVLAFSSGIIRRMSVFFPPGCQQLARCSIYEDESQRWPQNPDGYIAGDGAEVLLEQDYPIKAPSHQYVWRYWNVDDTESHTITLRAVVTPIEDFVMSLEAVAQNLSEFIELYKRQWRLDLL